MRLMLAWLSFKRIRWHVIYPNGVCSHAMMFAQAVVLRDQHGGRISKS